MKFRSILSFSPDLRTNAYLCLFFGVFFSLQSLITSVRILPNEKTKAIWNTDTLFVTCKKDSPQPGTLKWFSQFGEVEDNSKAPVYVQTSADQSKLFLMNVPKKNAGNYECRHLFEGRVINSDKFDLKVYTSINMEGNKDSYVGTEGQTFTMPCIAKFDSDSTEASISWNYNNLVIKDREGVFGVTNTLSQSVTQKNVKSSLTIKHLTKENEGTYTCEAVYGNPFMTDIKTIDINLRVQFKPRFPENTRRNVWISDSAGPIVVNVTCMVNADPVAEFQWLTAHGVPIEAAHLGIKHSVHNTENLSVLRLEYNDVNAIRNNFRSPDGSHRRFQCKANNIIGETKMTFELNIGRLPQTPALDKYHYENGYLVLSVNDSEVEPPIDIYRVDINGNHQIYFNASHRNPLANNTYQIEVDVPPGTHVLKIYSHNPVGWSENYGPDPPLQLVINSASGVELYLSLLVMTVVSAVVRAL